VLAVTSAQSGAGFGSGDGRGAGACLVFMVASALMIGDTNRRPRRVETPNPTGYRKPKPRAHRSYSSFACFYSRDPAGAFRALPVYPVRLSHLRGIRQASRSVTPFVVFVAIDHG
jgi:hypothetical protein